MSGFRRCISAFLVASFVGGCATQAQLSSSDIDALVAAVMQEHSVPGAVVGVVKDGIVVHASAYGVRELGLSDPVDTGTLFRIASTTKAMTSASLAILVDEGKLNWDDKVVEHIPEFALYDPWVSKEFTVADLLTHRSGLEGGAGDLMLWPKPNKFTRADLIAGLSHFKPESGFRTEYAYDNLLYIVAGELVPAVTGIEWETFVQQRVLDELDAERCFAGRIPDEEMQNLAAPHTLIDAELQVVDRNRIRAEIDVAAAAGGVRCDLTGMLRWVQLQLARGALPDGTRVFSEAQSRIMWSPHTILGVSEEQHRRNRTHFRAYGLGWRLADVQGYKEVAHTGSYTGVRAQVVLVPEIDLGVVVMINASASAARSAIADAIVRPYLQAGHVVNIPPAVAANDSAADAVVDAESEDIDFRSGSVDAALSVYAGLYRDPWFGDVSIEIIDDALWFASDKSPKMLGQLWPLENNTFYAYWADRTLEADAFITFVLDENGRSTGMDVLQVSEESDWDFTDLGLVRVSDD